MEIDEFIRFMRPKVGESTAYYFALQAQIIAMQEILFSSQSLNNKQIQQLDIRVRERLDNYVRDLRSGKVLAL